MKKLKIFTIALMLSFSAPAFAGQVVTVDVNGLVCDFCAVATEKVFGKQEAVEGVKVDLTAKTVTIKMKDGKDMPDELITSLIKDSGYDVREIRRKGAADDKSL